MKQGDGTEHELNLLLGDYGKSSRQWWETVHSQVHSPPKAILQDRDSQNPLNAGASDLTIALLFEDYPSRAERWLSQFSSAKILADKSGGAERPLADPGSPPLNLLLEGYAPGTRFLDRLEERSRKTFDSTGPGDRRTRADLAPRPSAAVPAQGATTRVAEVRLDSDAQKQASSQELEAGAHVPRPVGAPSAPEQAPGVPGDEPELRLLLRWDDYIEPWRRRGNAISATVHASGVLLVLLHSALAPRGVFRSTDLTQQQDISLFAPTAEQLARLTQPVPADTPPTKEFRGAPEEARPLLVLPQIIEPEPPLLEPEPAPQIQVEEETEPEPPEAEAAAPEPLETEEPVETPAAQSPSPGEFRRGREFARGPTELPAPRAPSRRLEKPKLVLEDPKARMPSRPGPLRLGSLELSARTGDITEGSLQQLRQGGVRQAVGDGFGTGGLGGYLPPSPGNTGSNLELLSDPKGVDFRPYLLQILATVRRNWFAVIPESARLGMSRGRVAIQFAIGLDGSVPKLVIATSSGVTSLDRAAVAGISASNPFPPLPREYSGNDVRLQFQFRYNIKGQ